jgi:hypothetical protein
MKTESELAKEYEELETLQMDLGVMIEQMDGMEKDIQIVKRNGIWVIFTGHPVDNNYVMSEGYTLKAALENYHNQNHERMFG